MGKSVENPWRLTINPWKIWRNPGKIHSKSDGTSVENLWRFHAKIHGTS